MARISELVKTYKLINDPDAPQWNIRFVGALAIVALLAGGAGLLAYTYGASDAKAPAAAALADGPGAAREGATVTIRIMAPTAIPGVALDVSADAAKAVADWKAAHPEARVVGESAVRDTGGNVVGYDVTYVVNAS